MKKIIVTGATGMIGSALIREAVKQEIEVVAIVRPNSKRLSNCPDSPLLTIIPCTINNYRDLNLNDKYDVFYHLAWDKTFGSARDDVYVQSDNIKYTLDAVNLAKKSGCSAFVGIGSQAEYGPALSRLDDKTPADPQSGYGIAKYAAGKLSRILCGQLTIRHCWIRILSIYGEYDAPHTLIMYCISQLLNGNKPSLTNCDQLWDYLYCSDAAKALLAAGRSGKNGKTYCLGGGRTKKLKEYVEIIRDCIDPKLPLGFGEKPYYSNQPMYLCADISELTTDTGFIPQTDFYDGIKKTIEWCKKNEIN